jgi:DNA-binding NtrC family response regulator
MNEPIEQAKRHARVFVLEDDVGFRDVLVELLVTESFDVTTCSSYSTLRTALAVHPKPIVLADFWGTSHADLSPDERAEIRELGRLAPTVLMTGRAWAMHANAQQLGVVSIVAKPPELDDIIVQVRRCLALVGAD